MLVLILGGGFGRVVRNMLVMSAAFNKQAARISSSPQQLSLALSVISSNAGGNTLHLKDGGYITAQDGNMANCRVSEGEVLACFLK